jgi:SAM-dependent methyltransferase
MLERCRRSVAKAGLERAVFPIMGDTHRLSFPTGTFHLVTALGVLSWLDQPGSGIAEIARVTRPGGYILVTSLNSLDVAHLLDPGRTPLLAPARSAVRLAAVGLGQPRRDRVRPIRHLDWSIRWRLRRGGLVPIRQTTVGFGPFTFFGSTLLSGDHGVRMDEVLQRLTDRECRLIRSSGRLFMVLAAKPELA